MDGANCCCNCLWFFLGGFEICLVWMISGVFCCVTIIGIPAGIQCFKIGCFALFPFGKEIAPKPEGYSCCDYICNCLWIFSFGLIIAILECFFGLIYCITIIGIPFGLQHFKLAKLSFMPFGSVIQVKGSSPSGISPTITQPIVVVQTGGYAAPPPQY